MTDCGSWDKTANKNHENAGVLQCNWPMYIIRLDYTPWAYTGIGKNKQLGLAITVYLRYIK